MTRREPPKQRARESPVMQRKPLCTAQGWERADVSGERRWCPRSAQWEGTVAGCEIAGRAEACLRAGPDPKGDGRPWKGFKLMSPAVGWKRDLVGLQAT